MSRITNPGALFCGICIGVSLGFLIIKLELCQEVPIIYTNREDDVLPAYNIRTDRWEIAQQAMDAVNQANLAKSKNYGKIEQQEKNALESKEIGDTPSQQDSVG